MTFALPIAERRPNVGPGPRSGPLVDTFGRIHNNLRVSVTDRCNLRCTYCMPEDVTFLDKGALLTFEEIVQFVRAACGLGIDKVRLTGGEPLMRRDLAQLVKMLAAVPDVRDMGLTTNALLLAEQAAVLRSAGLHRLNISLDTLDADRFRAIARRDGLDRVLAGIEAAMAVGFDSIKLNAVVVRGMNDEDVVPLARYAVERGLEMRYIEYMPIGAEAWERDKLVPAAEILEQLASEFGPLKPATNADPRAPAQEFETTGGLRFGMISSISRPFCLSCNRIRLTADGKLRHCLFALEETDVKELIRGGSSVAELQAAIRETVWAKWEGHEINTARFVKPARTMHAIGG